VGKPEVKNPRGRPRRRWKDNINIDFQELVFESMYWIKLPQDRNKWQALLNAVMNLWVSGIAGNFLTGRKPVCFSRRSLLHEVMK